MENQKWADERIPELLKVPAAIRFLSMEPLLGPVRLPEHCRCCCWSELNGGHDHSTCGPTITEIPGIGWVIVGGESGPDARAMHPAWAAQLRVQCQEAGVPFFFKQWGEWAVPAAQAAGSRTDTVRMARVGKKAAGRQLDGREYSEFPAGSVSCSQGGGSFSST